MDLSVIIVSWNVKKLLEQCLLSIYEQSEGLDLEIIVVDNNSSDQTVKMVAEKFPKVKLIANDNNAGFAKANNQGIEVASGRLLLLLNPDTKILDKALITMVSFMERRQDVALAGCQLVNADNSLQPSVRRFPTLGTHLGMMFKLHHFFSFKHYQWQDFDYGREAQVKQLMGAFIMMRRSAWEKIGQLDEKYYLWFEEVDYCLRADKSGLKIVYTPVAKIVHYGEQSFKQAENLKKQYYFSLSRLHFVKKYSPWWQYWLIWSLTPVSLFLTILNSLFTKNAK